MFILFQHVKSYKKCEMTPYMHFSEQVFDAVTELQKSIFDNVYSFSFTHLQLWF